MHFRFEQNLGALKKNLLNKTFFLQPYLGALKAKVTGSVNSKADEMKKMADDFLKAFAFFSYSFFFFLFYFFLKVFFSFFFLKFPFSFIFSLFHLFFVFLLVLVFGFGWFCFFQFLFILFIFHLPLPFPFTFSLFYFFRCSVFFFCFFCCSINFLFFCCSVSFFLFSGFEVGFAFGDFLKVSGGGCLAVFGFEKKRDKWMKYFFYFNLLPYRLLFCGVFFFKFKGCTSFGSLLSFFWVCLTGAFACLKSPCKGL